MQALAVVEPLDILRDGLVGLDLGKTLPMPDRGGYPSVEIAKDPLQATVSGNP